MKNTSILLNAGRGSAVNTEDLCEALIQGQIYGAGLDVTDPEPLQTQHKLWNVENVIITPHVAGDFSSSCDFISNRRYYSWKPAKVSGRRTIDEYC